VNFNGRQATDFNLAFGFQQRLNVDIGLGRIARGQGQLSVYPALAGLQSSLRFAAWVTGGLEWAAVDCPRGQWRQLSTDRLVGYNTRGWADDLPGGSSECRGKANHQRLQSGRPG
jgi:hypothetical protein